MQKTSCMWKKYIWNPSTRICVNGKYLAIITVDSVIKFVIKLSKKQKVFEQILMEKRLKRVEDIDLIIIFLMKNLMKIFWFMIFHTKHLWVWNHCVLGSIT